MNTKRKINSSHKLYQKYESHKNTMYYNFYFLHTSFLVMKNMYCSVLCLEKNRVPNKRENTDVVRTKCVKITDQEIKTHIRWIAYHLEVISYIDKVVLYSRSFNRTRMKKVEVVAFVMVLIDFCLSVACVAMGALHLNECQNQAATFLL